MAKALNKAGLTKLELKIMQVIWKHGRCSVSAVQEELEPPLAYTTVQTMLNILERKGKLKRTLEGRAYIYSPTISESKAHGQGLRDLIDRRVVIDSVIAIVVSIVEEIFKVIGAGILEPFVEHVTHRRIDSEALAQQCAKRSSKGAPAVHQFEVEARAAMERELGQHAVAEGMDGENRRMLE